MQKNNFYYWKNKKNTENAQLWEQGEQFASQPVIGLRPFVPRVAKWLSIFWTRQIKL